MDTILLANPQSDLYGSDRMLVETVRAVVGAGRRAVVTVPYDGPLVELLTTAGAEVAICPTLTISKGLLSPRVSCSWCGRRCRCWVRRGGCCARRARPRCW